MGTPEIIFGLLVLAVGVFATAAYGMIPVDDKTARGCFYATAFFLIAVGIELGIVTSWPLGIKMLAAGSVAFVAIAGLTYVLNSRPFITGDSQTTQHDIEVLPPERGYLLLWDPPNKMYIQSVPWPGDKLPRKAQAFHHRCSPQFATALEAAVGRERFSGSDRKARTVPNVLADADQMQPGQVFQHVLGALRNCPNDVLKTNSSICSD